MRCRLPSFQQLAKKQEEPEEEVAGNAGGTEPSSKPAPLGRLPPILTQGPAGSVP